MKHDLKLLQLAERVSGVGGFMFEFATGALTWTQQTYRIYDLDENCTPTLSLIESLMAQPERQRLHEAVIAARETGAAYDLEMPVLTATRRAIWIRMAGEVEFEGGMAVRLVGAIQDITDRCKLEQRLREAIARADGASKSKSEFLANMSHEIRTPLNAVIGLGYLLAQTTLSEDQRQFLSKIQFAGRALLGVINNVLDLSKIEADELSLEDEPFDLAEVVHDVSEMLRPQAIAKDIEVGIGQAPGIPRLVMGDAPRMRQVLTNLLNNAIKFTERGRVDLALFCTEQNVGRIRLRCEVKDTGIGIDPAACDRLFMPFTQADASTTRRFGGTGLGLSIARRLIELMGGEIGVVSRPGAGSTFWIEIPLRVAPDADGRLTVDALRVLILDTQGDTPQGLGASVRALGWNAQVVDGSEQLLAMLGPDAAPTRADALILDLHGRGADARQLLERLERIRTSDELPSVIVVAESAQDYLEHKPHLRPHHVLLVRPVTSSALFNAINLALSRRSDYAERIFVATNFDELHARWLAGVRVLVVDDSDINLEVAQRILEKQGATVTTCGDGASALAHLREHHRETDVILMDVQMPNLDGNEATRRIRRDMQLATLPIVALTAGALVGERQRSLEAGMNDFISKPFDPQLLIRKVRRLVESVRGEPIPMVFDDKRNAPASAAGLGVRSIDAAVVQQMFGDDLSLFKGLLMRLLRDYADLAQPLPVSLADESACLALGRRAHKLKGSAGMIGAQTVMRLAAALERVLQERRSADAVAGVSRKLAAALAVLREEAEPLVRPAPDAPTSHRPPAAVPAVVPAVAAAQIGELCELLEAQNLAAVDKFEELSPALKALLEESRFCELHQAVDNLDFQQGAVLLRLASGKAALSATP